MCLKCLRWNHSSEKFKNPKDDFKDAEKAHSGKHSQCSSYEKKLTQTQSNLNQSLKTTQINSTKLSIMSLKAS